MIRVENECVGCPQGCIHCGRDKTQHLYCDRCGEDSEELFIFDGEELCEDCLKNSLERITLFD